MNGTYTVTGGCANRESGSWTLRREIGLVAFYPMEGNTNDMSGTGNDGIASGAVSYLSGKIGQAANFDGATEYISVSDSPSLALNTFTLAAWVNPTDFAGGNRVVEKGASDSYWLDVNPEGKAHVGFFDGFYEEILSPSPVPLNSWSQVAGTYDGTILRLYVNGILTNTLPITSVPRSTTEPLLIGWKYNGVTNDHFAGSIDELRIYNRALTPSEIQQLVLVSGAATAYVNNYGSNSVSAIETSTNTVTNTISVGTNPGPTVLSGDGSKVYVGNNGTNTVSVISTSTNSVTGTIQIGGGPCNIVLTPNGTKAYVSNSAVNTVSVIDTVTDGVTKTVAVGAQPCGTAVTPNGRKVYVSNQDASSISVIDVATDTATTTIPVGSSQPFR